MVPVERLIPVLMPLCHTSLRLARAPGLIGLWTAAFLLSAASLRAASNVPLTGVSLTQVPERHESTLFTLVPKDQTGIKVDNHYVDPRMTGDLFQEFESGSLGTGLALGDYDGDGRPDLFVVSKTESCRLFRNLGDFRFEDVTLSAGVGDLGPDAAVWKQGVTFVDINNDGRLDLYLCRFNAPNRLYLNQGDGTFKEQAQKYGLDIVDASVMAAFCDYDRDGLLDLYLSTNLLDSRSHPNGQKGRLLHQNRDHTFTDVSDEAGITGESQCHSATWWDYDNDGWPDLYVANDYGEPDKLYRNFHDGTFRNALDSAAPHTSFSSMGADLGDVNNDGLIDFLVADMAATTHKGDQNYLADARGRSEEPSPGSKQTLKYHRNALLLATGTPRLLEGAFLANLAATDWTWSVRLEDVDNDGRLDLLVTNGFPHDPGVDTVKRMQSVESQAERTRILTSTQPQLETHWAFRNLGDLRFENETSAWGLDHNGIAFGAAFGDLDGDGNLDMVYSNFHDTVSVFRNNGGPGHRVLFDLRGTTSNRFGVGATITVESALGIQVRQLVLARGYLSSSEPVLHFGLGPDTTLNRVTVTWPSGLQQHFENLPADHRYTLEEPPVVSPVEPPASSTAVEPPAFREASTSLGLSFVQQAAFTDELAAQKLLPRRLGNRGPSLAVGDLNGDGLDDVILGGTTLAPLRILTASENGFKAASLERPPSELDDGPVLLFDAQANGTLALLVTKAGNLPKASPADFQPSLFWNDGHGNLTPAPAESLPPLAINAGAVAAADFTHNGKLGLFLGARSVPGLYPKTPHSALLLNKGGRFEDVTNAFAPGLSEVGLVTAALWCDVDDDGWPDLLLALDWGTVKYFHNRHGEALEDRSSESGFAAGGRGWWTSLASADFNNDGRPDFVVGNVGLNTQYHASAAQPAVLYHGNFGGPSAQLVEAYYEGEALYPWRSRRDLVSALPYLGKKFPRVASFGSATVEQIFGSAPLAATERWEATELQSGVFLSQPDDTYRFAPLPRLAQIAPLQGVATGDFDGDGYADIYAVQNDFSPIPAVGRFDGGLSQLLVGDGHGGFGAVPVVSSGLSVPGDAKSLCVVDLNHDQLPDFLISRNQDSTLAFLSQPSRRLQALCVRLRGPAGNPSGVGAKVTLSFDDGTSLTHWVEAGSGLLSQSSATLFFTHDTGKKPRTLSVRWPDNSVTSEAVPPGVTERVLTHPL